MNQAEIGFNHRGHEASLKNVSLCSCHRYEKRGPRLFLNQIESTVIAPRRIKGGTLNEDKSNGAAK